MNEVTTSFTVSAECQVELNCLNFAISVVCGHFPKQNKIIVRSISAYTDIIQIHKDTDSDIGFVVSNEIGHLKQLQIRDM